jgi:hypothetical protein
MNDDVILKANLGEGASDAELSISAEPGADGKPTLPTFAMTAYNGGPMRPYGWYAEEPIIIDLEGMDVPAAVPIDAGHITDVGHTTKIEKATKSLKASGVLSSYSESDDDDEAMEARKMVRKSKNGFPFQASVDVVAARSKVQYFRAGETVRVNGRTFDGPVSVARASKLQKIAILSRGADSTTETKIAAKPGGLAMNPEFVEWLKASGLPEAPPADQLPGLQAMFAASKSKPAPVPIAKVVDPKATIEEERKLRAAEIKRTNDIHRICSQPDYASLTVEVTENGVKSEVSIEAHAVAEGWTADQAELHCRRASRPQGPMGFAHSHETDCTADVLSAALMVRAGAKLDHKSYGTHQAVAVWGYDKKNQPRIPAWMRAGINDPARNRVMDLAHSFAAMHAMDFLREVVRVSGQEVPRSQEHLFRAAFSGSTLTNIFTNSVNAKLVATYQEAPDTTAGWTQETDVNDFKINTDIRLTKGGRLTVHPRGGEADHMRRSDTAEQYQAARFSGQMEIDEQDFIDDMLGALNEFPVEMANASARLRPDLVYAALLANPTLAATARALFNATDDNVDTTSALAAATLRTGIANMNVKQENGVNLNFNPSHVIVPSSLRFLAKELISSGTLLLAGTAGSVTERGTANVLVDENLTMVSDARLENGVTDPLTGTVYSGSTSTWYLACAIARTILVAYLAGTGRAPRTRSFTLDKGKWGMGWDITMDIGAKARDFRGLYRATA